MKEEIFEKDIHELEQIIAKKDESLNAILDKY